ncbi:MAG: hypothetical protein DMF75_20145 [Acidobacteria bacterium]|nr:MAG: hypothetical protein DMF75_20145 [Acidobacteriota bacterium]
MKKRKKKNRKTQSRRLKVQRSSGPDLFSQTQKLLQKIGEWRYTAVVLGSAYFIVAGLISFRYHKILDYGMESDFLFEYVPSAREISHGHLPIGDYRGPVYPILLATVKAILGDYFKAGLLIGLLAAAVTLALSFMLIRRLFDSRIALSVALLLMGNPYFFMYSYQAGTDMLFSALVTASLYCLLAGTEMSWKYSSASALLAGLAYLTRYNGIFILAAPALILFSNHLQLSWKRRFVAATLFGVLFFICIAPWGLYCLKEKGSFFYSANRLNIAFDIYGKNQMSREEFFWKGNPFENTSIPALVLYDPRVFFGTLVRNFFDHGLKTCEYLLGWPLTVLGLGGATLLLIRKVPSRQRTYLLLNLAFFLVLLPIHFEVRYPLFMLGGLLTLSACGLFLWSLNIGDRVRTASLLALVGLAIYTGFNSYDINRQQISAGPKEVLAVADQFKAKIPSDKRGRLIAARKPHIAYYTGLEYVPLPFASSPEELIQQLKNQKVDYLYFGPMEYSMRPDLRVLIDSTQSWPGLKAIVASEYPLSVLYKVE